MPILDRGNASSASPGLEGYTLVDGAKGAESLRIGDLTYHPGGKSTIHTHTVEEAMCIVEGELEAALGDEFITVRAGQTVLAPAGVAHGLANRGNSTARVVYVFPTAEPDNVVVAQWPWA